MLALLMIPALLGLAFIVDTGDDEDTPEFDPVEDFTLNDESVETIMQPANPVFVGSATQDVVTGTAGDDQILGHGGHDILDSRGGVDFVNGEAGNDTIFAGDGDDYAVGGIGNDSIFLQNGDDIYSTLDLDDDSIDRGDDFVSGGNGNDSILDFRGSDTLSGDAGDDVLVSFGYEQTPDPADRLDGGDGNDTLFGDNGDVMLGGAGDDLFAIVRPEDFNAEAVTIEDFNTDDDVLTLFVPDAGNQGETIDLQFDPEANALRAFWRGDEVAVLNGLNSSDIGRIEISILDAEDIASSGIF